MAVAEQPALRSPHRHKTAQYLSFMTPTSSRNLLLASFGIKVMAKAVCPICHRSEGDLHPGSGQSESREVSLANIQSAAEKGCSLCSFVKKLLEQDNTTPKKEESEYEDAVVRVEDDGLRFTGQWQGALVIEIYQPRKSPRFIRPSSNFPGILQPVSPSSPHQKTFTQRYHVSLRRVR